MTDHRRTVLITGAGGYLGRAATAAFRATGAQLVLLDHHTSGLEEAHGRDAGVFISRVDLRDRAAVTVSVGQACDRFGGVDAVCHIAGGFRMGDAVHETDEDTWDFLMDLNARSFMNVAAAVVPRMLERGHGQIVTVGAGAAQRGQAHMGAYCASKSALIRLTESMSAELKGKGINVNCVAPSIIDTPDNRAAMWDADPAQWVTPDALSDVLVFLTSNAARAVHGAVLPVSGLA